MAAYTTYVGGASIAAPVGSNGGYAGAPARTILEGVFDASRRNLIAADTASVINVPAGFLLSQVAYRVEVAEVTATQTFDIGKIGTLTAYVAAASSSAAAGTRGVGAVVTSAVGELFAADTAVVINIPTAMVATTFKVRVFLIGTVLS